MICAGTIHMPTHVPRMLVRARTTNVACIYRRRTGACARAHVCVCLDVDVRNVHACCRESYDRELEMGEIREQLASVRTVYGCMHAARCMVCGVWSHSRAFARVAEAVPRS